MLLELAEITVREGKEDAFAAAMRESGVQSLVACEGVV